MRALHGLPAGTELTLSYFPLHWDLQQRQAQAQQVGGIVGGCVKPQERTAACVLSTRAAPPAG
jgi:SET and MYND domain-containing protein